MECSLSGSASGYLDALYEEYEGFDVQQTTVGIDRQEFDVIEARPDGIAIRVRIHGDDGVLALPDGDGWVLPGGVTDAYPDRTTVADLAERWTGIACSIDGLERVSLVGLQCEGSEKSLWTVSTVFTATAGTGSPHDGVVWREQGTPVEIPFLA